MSNVSMYLLDTLK